MARKKPQPEEKPITARPVGSGYWVQQTGKEKRFLGEMVSDGRLQSGPGCYRRLPTNKE